MTISSSVPTAIARRSGWLAIVAIEREIINIVPADPQVID